MTFNFTKFNLYMYIKKNIIYIPVSGDALGMRIYKRSLSGGLSKEILSNICRISCLARSLKKTHKKTKLGTYCSEMFQVNLKEWQKILWNVLNCSLDNLLHFVNGFFFVFHWWTVYSICRLKIMFI